MPSGSVEVNIEKRNSDNYKNNRINTKSSSSQNKVTQSSLPNYYTTLNDHRTNNLISSVIFSHKITKQLSSSTLNSLSLRCGASSKEELIWQIAFLIFIFLLYLWQPKFVQSFIKKILELNAPKVYPAFGFKNKSEIKLPHPKDVTFYLPQPHIDANGRMGYYQSLIKWASHFNMMDLPFLPEWIITEIVAKGGFDHDDVSAGGEFFAKMYQEVVREFLLDPDTTWVLDAKYQAYTPQEYSSVAYALNAQKQRITVIDTSDPLLFDVISHMPISDPISIRELLETGNFHGFGESADRIKNFENSGEIPTHKIIPGAIELPTHIDGKPIQINPINIQQSNQNPQN